MFRCEKCGGKGYILGYIAKDAKYTPAIEQCPLRCNTRRYSALVQARLNDKDPRNYLDRPCKVVPLRKKDER